MLTRFRGIMIWIIVLLIVFSFIARGLESVREETDSTTTDQSAFLQLGFQIRERMRLTDGNRHPLYPALLSFFAKREWAYFTEAKLLNLAIGTAALIILFLLSRRMYNDDVALLSTFLLSINEVFIKVSSKAICEPLLTLLFLLSWYYTVKGFSNWRYWIIAGICGGLAYLTKGSGLMLLLAYIITAILVYRTQILRQKQLLIFPLFFILISSPLLIYNYKLYHNPIYNINMAHYTWMDEWEDKYRIPKKELPTLFTYVKTHTPRQILLRQWKGMRKIETIFLLVISPFGKDLTYDLVDMPVCLVTCTIAILAVVFGREMVSYYKTKREEMIFTITTFLLFYLSLGWFAQVSAKPRFVIPLVPIAYMFMGGLLYEASKRLLTRLFSPGASKVKILALLSRLILYGSLALWVYSVSSDAVEHLFEDPFKIDRFKNLDKDYVLSWLEERVDEDTMIIKGPRSGLPRWKYPQLRLRSVRSKFETWDAFVAYLREREARYFILDKRTFLGNEALFSQYFRLEGDKINFSALPPGWKLAFAFNGLPCNWCIFELIYPLTISIDHPLQVSFGGKIRLLGYDLDVWPLKSKGKVQLIQITLYWQALDTIQKDYTVFTHLLGEDGLVWGQQDGQPVRGLRPTSTWKTGDIVVDHYYIVPSSDAPSGKYRIEVGMYLLDTMERLSAVDENGKRLPEDRILLEPVILIER